MITDLASLRELLCRVEALWVSFESTHAKYIPGIKKPKRQRETEQRFTILQEKFSNIMGRCRQRLHLESPQGVKDHISMRSTISTSSHGSRLSRASSGSSQEEKLRTVLLAKKKLELARARAKEEEEEARRNAQQQSKRELRRLEEAALAELEWKIETDYDKEVDLTNSLKNCKPFVAENNQNKSSLENNTRTCSSANPRAGEFYKPLKFRFSERGHQREKFPQNAHEIGPHLSRISKPWKKPTELE